MDERRNEFGALSMAAQAIASRVPPGNLVAMERAAMRAAIARNKARRPSAKAIQIQQGIPTVPVSAVQVQPNMQDAQIAIQQSLGFLVVSAAGVSAQRK
jgi:hypothetical protein